jgi:phosphohistidine phosphatase
LKTLLLVRHALADPGEGGMADQARPLSARGRLDASEMGRRLVARSLPPDVIVSSAAVRARDTAELIAAELGVERSAIRVSAALYNASSDELLDEVTRLDDALGCAMMVAHNPGLAELANRFDPGITHLVPGAMAGFRFAAESWGEAAFRQPAGFLFLQPRQGQE